MHQSNLSGTEHPPKRNQQFILRSLAVICCVLMATALTFAQGTRGSIRGTVTDPNGAAVVGATVTLFDVARQQEIRTVQSNESGEYQFLELEPAVYEIATTSTGFSGARLREIKVEPNRNLQLDVQLAIGIAGTTVEVDVTGTQELLDFETPTLGTTVDRRRVQDLPLNGRNILDLALIQPGVVEANQNSASTTGLGSGFRVHGNRGVENNITLDGSNNNEVAVGGATGAQPRPDAVQEFRILTNNFEAEFGRNTGSVVNVVVNSGTNDYHGNGRLFYRPTRFSAARFFDKALAPPALLGTDAVKRRFERKEFGGNIGGPLYLPRFGEGGRSTHLGKNKAFFFIDYEGRRQLIGDTRTILNLPTPDERQGIFNRPTTNLLLDPATNLPFPIIETLAGGRVRQQIPGTRFIGNPIVTYYSSFLPVADASGTARAGANQLVDNDYLTARIDFLATNNQTFNFTFNRFQGVTLSPFAFGGSQLPGFGSVDPRKTYNMVLRHTYTITPTLVNSFLAGYARNSQAAAAPNNQTTPAEIGFTRSDFIALPQFTGPPVIRLFDRADLRIGNTVQGPQSRLTENFQLQDSVSWATGDHRFKFGFDGTQYRGQQNFAFINNGGILFSSQFGGNTSGDDFADFLLGNPVFIQVGNKGDLDFRQNAYALFAQDTWRVTDELTLSLGLRYEYNSPIEDKFGRTVFYRPNSDVVSQSLVNGFTNFEGFRVTVPVGGRAPRGVIFPGDPDPVLGTASKGGVRPDRNNFAPRLGFAYSPTIESPGLLKTILGDRKTVIRGGFGINFGAVVGDVALQQLGAPGFGTLVTQLFNQGAGTTADPFGPDPFPNFVGVSGRVAPTSVLNCAAASVICNGTPLTNPLTAPPTLGAPLLAFPGLVVNPNLRTPYTISTNFTIERGLGANHVLTLSYVGNRGRKLYGQRQVNFGLGTFVPFSATDPRRATVPTAGNINTRRFNDDVRTGITQQVSESNSEYDAFEANLQRRLSNGLLYQVAYTFSKSINEAESIRGGLDILDRRFGRGLSDDDVPHRLVISAIYDFQFAKGFSGFAKRALDGWSIGGIATFQSGTPISVFNRFDEAGTGGIVSFADFGTAPFATADPLTEDRRAFNANAFASFCDPALPGGALATCFRRGTSGRNQFRIGNDVNNFDLILSKKTQLWNESSNLELRLEAFNAFNHTQFTTVNLTLPASNSSLIPSAAFGKFTAARESRVVQFGVRLSF